MVYKLIRLFSLFIVLVVAVSSAGCLGKKAPAPRDVGVGEAPHLQHTVRYSGETLGLISRWYTGKVQNWQEIADANPNLLPERINIGQTIYIPRHLVIQEDPLPQETVGGSSSPAATSSGAVHSGTESSFGGRVMPQEPVEEVAPVAEPDTSASRDELLDELISDDEVDEPEDAPLDTAGAGRPTQDNSEKIEEVVAEEPPAEVNEPVEEPSADERERDKLLDELLSQ